MNNAKKIIDKCIKKPIRGPRTKKLSVDMSTLEDAIVDGKLAINIKDRVLFERTLNSVTSIHEGIIFGVEDNGNIVVWDETRGQFYTFNLNQRLPVIKVRSPRNVLI